MRFGYQPRHTAAKQHRRGAAALTAGTSTCALIFAMAGVAGASEIATSEVTGTTNEVTVTQGTSTVSTVNVTAGGALNCNIKTAGPGALGAATFQMPTSYSISSAGALSSSTPSTQYSFVSNGIPIGASGNCGTQAATYSLSTSWGAALTTPVGNYTFHLSTTSAEAQTAVQNPASPGLSDTDETQVVVHVVAPVNNNHSPTVMTAAVDATGDEGDTLQASGTFQDSDGDSLSLSVPNGTPGTFNDNGGGNWSWSLNTTDETSGSVTVTANDGHGGTATDSFDFSAVNVAPSTPGTPALQTAADSPNKDGQFVLDWTASTDPGLDDTVTYTLRHKDADSDWSSVATGITSNSYAFDNTNAESEGSWVYQVKATDGTDDSSYSDTSNTVVVDETAPNAPSVSLDGAPTPDYTDGDGLIWFATAPTVTVTDNGDDPLQDGSDGSGVDPSSFDTSPSTTEGANHLSETVKDYADNESSAGTLDFGVDTTAPTVSLDCAELPLTVHVGDNFSLDWSATDATGGSGVATGFESGSITPSTTVGAHTVSVASAASIDNVGNESAVSNTCSYTAVYNWTGFFQPIDNVADPSDGTTPGATAAGWNKAKAGSAIPVKFSLGGDRGLGIFATGYPVAKQVTCPSGTIVADTVEESSTGTTSGLKYDATAQQYNYTWKTTSSWANTCQRLQVKLVDGTSHYAFFKFTK